MLSAFVRARRRALNMTRFELAEAAGCEHFTLLKIEAGFFDEWLPPDPVLYALSGPLATSYDILAGDQFREILRVINRSTLSFEMKEELRDSLRLLRETEALRSG